MKILQAVSSDQRRGAEVFAGELSDSLRLRGHDVRVASLGRSSSTPRLTVGMSYDGNHCGVRGFTRPAGWLKKQIRSMDADVLQANGGSTLKYGAIAAWIDPHRSWKLVYRNIGDLRVWLSSPSKRLFYKTVVWPKIDGVVCVSRQARDGLRAVYGEHGPPVEVIYQGVDEAGLRPRLARPEVRRTLATSEDEIAVVWVGALSREKRPDRALRVLSRLKFDGKSVVLWMVGTGPLQDKVVEVARNLGVADAIRWVGSVEDVGTYLHAADIFLLTSDTEGIPAALVEAMTVGLPSVVTDVGGISEAADAGRTGFLASPEDEDGLAGCLLHLAGDEMLRGRIGAEARNDAVRRFSMDRCVDGYEVFYRSILNSRAAR